jgi:hypothetical protein
MMSHIMFCHDPAREQVYNTSVNTLVKWLASQRTDATFTMLLSTYLGGRGDVLMMSLCSYRSPYYELSEMMVDRLGIRSLLEGRIPCADHWCNGLILRLLQTFRNGTVHLRGSDGLLQAQQDRLTSCCEELLWTDPSTLLDEDKFLLEIDLNNWEMDLRQHFKHVWSPNHISCLQTLEYPPYGSDVR